MIKVVKPYILLAVLGLFLALTVVPATAHAQLASTVYNTQNFQTEADGTLSQTNGSAQYDPTTFTAFPVLSTLGPPNVEGGAFRAPTGCTAGACFNVAALPIRGDGRITAMFGGQDGASIDANIRWGLEWLDTPNLQGMRVQVRPGWQELRVERINVGVVDATHEIIALSQPLVPGVDRVGFEKTGDVFKVFVNDIQVSADITDSTYTSAMTDIVLGALAPSGTTFPRWLWYAYTSEGDYILGANEPTQDNTTDQTSFVAAAKTLSETGQTALPLLVSSSLLICISLGIAIRRTRIGAQR